MHILFAYTHIGEWGTIHQFLRANKETLVVKEVLSFSEMVRQIEKGCFDIVLLDWDLPGMSPQLQVDFIEKICPQTRVIVMATRPDVEEKALSAGAEVFISNQESADRLRERIMASQDLEMN